MMSSLFAVSQATPSLGSWFDGVGIHLLHPSTCDSLTCSFTFVCRVLNKFIRNWTHILDHSQGHSRQCHITCTLPCYERVPSCVPFWSILLQHFFPIVEHGSYIGSPPTPSICLLFLLIVSSREILFMVLGYGLISVGSFSRCSLSWRHSHLTVHLASHVITKAG